MYLENKKIIKMKKSDLKFLVSFLFAFCGVITLNSCSHVDDEEGVNIAGEWLEDDSTDDDTKMYISNYKEGGGMANCWIKVTADEGFVNNKVGTYSVKGSDLTLNYYDDMINMNVMEEYSIRNVTDYTLMLYYAENGSTTTAYRIIDTYNMKVGETRNVSIEDSKFSPSAYKSNYKRIATVNNNGVITAVKRGTAYIIASSATEKAVIRVVVTDPNNAIDDYMSYLGCNLDAIKNAFGKSYTELTDEYGDSFLHYYIYDDYYESAVFYYKLMEVGWLGWQKSNVVNRIFIDIRENVSQTIIKESLSKEFEYLGTIDGVELYGVIRTVLSPYGNFEHNVYVNWYRDERLLEYELDFDSSKIRRNKSFSVTKRIETKWRQ